MNGPKIREQVTYGIALLCPLCHSKKTRNFLSSRRILEAMAKPAAIQTGIAFSELEASTRHPYVVFAGLTLKNCETPVEIKGLPVLRIESAEAQGGPFRISASFFDRQGRPSLFIRRNEWRVFADSWDVEAVGGKIIVRAGPGDIALRLVINPGEGVIVERIRMHCLGYLIEGSAGKLDVVNPSGGNLSFTNCLADNCKIGLSLN